MWSQRADQSSYNHKGVCYIVHCLVVVGWYSDGKDKHFS